MEQGPELTNGEVKQVGQAIMPDERDLYITRANTEIEACHTQIARSDRKLQLMRDELTQYRQDLIFWQKAHGSEYPVRRIAELDKKIQEIEQV
jgi:hypothetical protein